MAKIDTLLKDINGNPIYLEDKVWYAGEAFDVILNPFNKDIILDNDYGVVPLRQVHSQCRVLNKEG